MVNITERPCFGGGGGREARGGVGGRGRGEGKAPHPNPSPNPNSAHMISSGARSDSPPVRLVSV